MKQEEDKLQKFFTLFKSILEENKIFISNAVFHDYHFICQIEKKDLIDFTPVQIKVYIKPTSKSFRLIISKSTSFDPILIESFKIAEEKFWGKNLDISSIKNEKKNKLVKINENNKKNDKNKRINKNKSSNLIKIYIDGSYNKNNQKAGWAFCVIKNFEIIHKDYGIFDETEDKSQQVIAEIYALYKSVLWLIEKKIYEAEIIYDYKGIECWLTGQWNTKNENIKDIVNRIKNEISKGVIILHFTKVDSHTGDYYNEIVDKLAKEAAKNK